MKRSKRLKVTGSVQGMFFEAFIKEQAEKLNLKGYLRKLEDGRIEVFVEGDGENVDEMVGVTKRGSRHSQIRSVEEKDESFQGFSEFKILRI